MYIRGQKLEVMYFGFLLRRLASCLLCIMYALRQMARVFGKHMCDDLCIVTGHFYAHAVELLIMSARGLVPMSGIHGRWHIGKSTDRKEFSFALIHSLAMCLGNGYS